jgi:hypothetical protein
MNKNFTKQIDELTSRREALRTQLSEILAGIESQTKAMGGDMLAGKDTDKALDALTRARGKADALDVAIELAGIKLDALEAQQIEDTKQTAQAEYSALIIQAKEAEQNTIFKLYDFIDGLEQLENCLTSMNKIAAGFEFDRHEESNFQSLLKWLKHEFTLDLLPQLETSNAETCNKAKRRKK